MNDHSLGGDDTTETRQRDWLAYWRPDEFDREAQEPRLTHIASNQLSRVRLGDRVWVVSAPDGRLETLGWIPVLEPPVGLAEVRRRLGPDVYSAEWHLIVPSRSAIRTRRVDLHGLADVLRFASEGNDRLDLTDGRVNGQQLQTMRRLTAESAALIESAWIAGDRSDVSARAAMAAAEAEAERAGQGYLADPEARARIEAHAMTRAADHFRRLGFAIEDHHSTHPYDLRCRHGEEIVYVEVKGTQTSGASVFLTRNEVDFARAHRDRMALFVTHSIQLTRDGGGIVAANGTDRVLWPWDVTTGGLTPITYSYELDARSESEESATEQP